MNTDAMNNNVPRNSKVITGSNTLVEVLLVLVILACLAGMVGAVIAAWNGVPRYIAFPVLMACIYIGKWAGEKL